MTVGRGASSGYFAGCEALPVARVGCGKIDEAGCHCVLECSTVRFLATTWPECPMCCRRRVRLGQVSTSHPLFSIAGAALRRYSQIVAPRATNLMYFGVDNYPEQWVFPYGGTM